MAYYTIRKNKKKLKLKDKLNLKDGYTFKKKGITIYENSMINYIIKTKINIKLKKILDLYINNDDSDSDAKLIDDIETLRAIIYKNYMPHLSKKEMDKIEYKLNAIENKAKHKSMTR